MLAGYAAAHAQGFAELLYAEFGVHVALLHQRHHPIHQRTVVTQHLFLVGLDTLAHALTVALLVVEDVLDAPLQLPGVVRLLEHLAYRIQQLLGLNALQSGRPPIIYIYDQDDEENA